ncbi:MAG: hypothetical protein ACRCYP_02285 [Alphaproteobacteria bacterium]
MLERFWTFSLFIIEALKKEKKTKLTGPRSILDAFTGILNFKSKRGQLISQIKIIPLIFLGFIFLVLLGYRLISLQDQIFYYETISQEFQQRLQEKKKDLSFLRSLIQGAPINSLEYLLHAPKINRFAFGDRLKSLSQESGFDEMSFSLMPQKKILFKEDLSALLTTVSVSYRVGADMQLWQWMRRLSTEFSCFFIPRRLTVERIVSQDGFLEGIAGTYVVDWVTFDPIPKKRTPSSVKAF